MTFDEVEINILYHYYSSKTGIDVLFLIYQKDDENIHFFDIRNSQYDIFFYNVHLSRKEWDNKIYHRAEIASSDYIKELIITIFDKDLSINQRLKMPPTGIRGAQIQDETIEGIDIPVG